MILSVNQTRQFYFVNDKKNAGTPLTTEGQAYFSGDDGYIWLTQYGKGGITRSDLMRVGKILNANIAMPSKMEKKIPFYKLTIADEAIHTVDNNTYMLGNQDYVLDIIHNNFVAMGDENTYYKHGAVHTNNTTTPSDFYFKLVKSILANYYRELNNNISVYLIKSTTVGSTTTITNVKPDYEHIDDFEKPGENSVYTGILFGGDVDEIKKEFRIAVRQIQIPNFSFDGNEIYDVDNDAMVEWLTVANAAATDLTDITYTIGNGYEIADLEYACMTARGDYYGQTTYPDSFDTKYFCNTNTSDTYYVFNIHYALTEDNEHMQLSEKTITIVSPVADTQYSESEMKGLVDQFTALTGITPDVIS